MRIILIPYRVKSAPGPLDPGIYLGDFARQRDNVSKNCGPGYIQPGPQNTEGGYEREIDQISRAHNYIIIIYNVK